MRARVRQFPAAATLLCYLAISLGGHGFHLVSSCVPHACGRACDASHAGHTAAHNHEHAQQVDCDSCPGKSPASDHDPAHCSVCQFHALAQLFVAPPRIVESGSLPLAARDIVPFSYQPTTRHYDSRGPPVAAVQLHL